MESYFDPDLHNQPIATHAVCYFDSIEFSGSYEACVEWLSSRKDWEDFDLRVFKDGKLGRMVSFVLH